jgi:hypothetical protein
MAPKMSRSVLKTAHIRLDLLNWLVVAVFGIGCCSCFPGVAKMKMNPANEFLIVE